MLIIFQQQFAQYIWNIRLILYICIQKNLTICDKEMNKRREVIQAATRITSKVKKMLGRAFNHNLNSAIEKWLLFTLFDKYTLSPSQKQELPAENATY